MKPGAGFEEAGELVAADSEKEHAVAAAEVEPGIPAEVGDPVREIVDGRRAEPVDASADLQPVLGAEVAIGLDAEGAADLEDVGPGTAEQHVVARAADQPIVAGAAIEIIVAAAAEQLIIAASPQTELSPRPKSSFARSTSLPARRRMRSSPPPPSTRSSPVPARIRSSP